MLVRHAKSAWPDGVPDHDRPLAARGRRDAPAAGRWLRQAGCIPDRVLCSTARRARQTWEFAERELGARPRVTFEQKVYGASAGELLDLIRALPPSAATVAVVGHDPAIPDLALALAVPLSAVERIREKFPTAAVAVLAVREPWSALSAGQSVLLDFVTPRDLAS